MRIFKLLTIVLSVLMVFVLHTVSISPARALQEIIPPDIVVGCTGITDNDSLYEADRDNTGTGYEAYRFYAIDGYGNLIHDFSSSVSVGFIGSIGDFLYNITAPSANPITLYFVSLAGNGYHEQVVLVVQGSCAGLPTVPGCSLNVPAGSVVGEAPLGAHIYYAPGAVTEHILKPGTYIVVGQDASETYYKIVLACQFIWVRKDTMQPSFQYPQNGTPLPTRIVE